MTTCHTRRRGGRDRAPLNPRLGEPVMSEALAQVLGADRGEHSVEAAATAIAAYISGRSSWMARRESGVPERTIDRWVEQLGIERTPRETAKIKTAALEAGRVKSADVRRTLGAL